MVGLGLIEMLIVLGLLAFCGASIVGVVILLIQVGVIFQKAGEPPHKDMGGYSLDQGRDVGKDD